ncbi:RNA ligase family protein [Tianweitania sediminis]|uniref:ATP-dependent DNA ligase n=1 Tax=Tianweitania sediminis TaxID=1502156 RepID=A0A8J7R1R1_9HYPH|nr:RNA ligase family protein [Tianweitania sediminis]MBP0439123.1 ATP-dependent DNA ligase [Tianweitania sediminis]
MVQYVRPAGPRLEFIPPMLPTLAARPPEGGEWIHEIKYDGYRTQIAIGNGECHAFTRNGYDWSLKYRNICARALELGVQSAILDGEVIILGTEGHPDFKALRSAITTAQERLVFVAFDLLHLDGHDLRRMHLVERRALLEDLVPEDGPIQFSASHEGDAGAFFREVDRAGLEGMVSKRADGRYLSGRVADWLKIKCFTEDDLQVLGVVGRPGQATQAILADGEGRYVGKAAVTLVSAQRERLWARVKERPGAMPEGLPKDVQKEKADWLAPGLVGRVKFLRGEEWLRHATLRAVSEG